MLPEEQHLLTLMKTTMRVLGFTNRDVERRLGLSGSYLSRLFSGDIDLRFSHIVSISRAMGLEPEELLLLAYPHGEEPQSPAARRLAARLQGQPEPPPSPPPPIATGLTLPVEEMVERVVTRLLQRFGAGLAALPGRASPL